MAESRFVRNAWYMAAWAGELSEAFLSRRLLGTAILLTRDAEGTAVALRDRCPHRFAPLSMGTRSDDRIICGYHGLTFDLGGRCVRNPYGDRIPAGAVVESYPCVERDGIIWCWFGDREAVDPGSVPDFSATSARTGASWLNGLTPLKADYEYGTDNLLDLSHIEFLHTGTFAGNGVIFKGRHSVEQVGRQLHSNWWMPGVACPAGFGHVLQVDTVDHWLDMRWDAPANMYLQVGATRPGEPREAGMTLHQAHILTPAGIGETHYFWSSLSPYPLPPEQRDAFRELIRAAFEVEDKPMVEASYQNVGEGNFWRERPVSLGIDTAGTRARRIVEGLLRDERSELHSVEADQVERVAAATPA